MQQASRTPLLRVVSSFNKTFLKVSSLKETMEPPCGDGQCYYQELENKSSSPTACVTSTLESSLVQVNSHFLFLRQEHAHDASVLPLNVESTLSYFV